MMEVRRCGCYVSRDTWGNGEARITYCRLHAAAPDLLEASYLGADYEAMHDAVDVDDVEDITEIAERHGLLSVDPEVAVRELRLRFSRAVRAAISSAEGSSR